MRKRFKTNGYCVARNKFTKLFISKEELGTFDCNPNETSDLQMARIFKSSAGARNIRFKQYVKAGPDQSYYRMDFDDIWEIIPINIGINTKDNAKKV